MNILFLGGLSPPITGVRFANDVVYRELSRNHNIFMIDIKTKPKDRRRIQLFKLADTLVYIAKAVSFFSIERIDVLYCTMNQSLLGFFKFVPVLLLSNVCRVPYVLHFHGNLLPSTYLKTNIFLKKMIEKTLQGSSSVILLSEILAEQSVYEPVRDKVRIVYNFVDTSVVWNVRESHSEGPIKLIYMSNFIRSKGILDVLEACHILIQRGVDFELKLAGGWYDSDTKREVLAHAVALGDSVEVLGVVKGRKKNELLNWGDIFLLPTYYDQEGQPISMLEAMATGNLIITTNHSGIPDIIKSGANGFFVKARDPAGIAECVEHILSNNSVLDEIQRNNIEEAKRFSIDIFASEIEKILVNATYDGRH